MAYPELTATVLHAPAAPERVLVLMPGLGTAVAGTWDLTVEHLDDDSQVIGLDLPGHGRSPAWDSGTEEPSIAQLAHAVERTVTAQLRGSQLAGLPVHFAGISLAGGVALQIALRHSQTFASAAVVCSAARIGQPAAWIERAAEVRAHGTGRLVQGSVSRWFAEDFPAHHPAAVKLLAQALAEADDDSYAQLSQALSTFDLTDRLGEITVPVLVISGAHDTVTTAEDGAAVAASVPDSALHVLPGAAHQAPAEQPAQVAGLLNEFIARIG